ncbi:MAG TPA: hypothetical protein VHB21_23260, partial [Minicystis sp.]|nr:hypothetical protein [Minicystis sp.]
TSGQRRRVALFQAIEGHVCSRIEAVCGSAELDVQDVAVLVVAPAARPLVFGPTDRSPDAAVLLGHREHVYALLRASLPAAVGAPFDPYADLLEPAPARCVRVLVLDEESLTVMSYGTFVTVRMDRVGTA